MKITVVSVVWNAVDSIQDTLNSVLNQTYSEIEYIVIDGCSTDGTIEVLQQYKSKIAKLLVEKDNGVYDAMNKALDIATGDFLIFMNSGDTFVDSKVIEDVSKNIVQTDAVYYGDILRINAENSSTEVFGGKFNKYRICIKNISHQAIFYPKSVYKKYKYDLKYTIFADYIYNILLFSENVKFIYIHKLISNFQIGGLSAKPDENYLKDKSGIILNKFGLYYYLYYHLKSKLRIRKLLTFFKK